jgi:hypothetical protein
VLSKPSAIQKLPVSSSIAAVKPRPIHQELSCFQYQLTSKRQSSTTAWAVTTEQSYMMQWARFGLSFMAGTSTSVSGLMSIQPSLQLGLCLLTEFLRSSPAKLSPVFHAYIFLMLDRDACWLCRSIPLPLPVLLDHSSSSTASPTTQHASPHQSASTSLSIKHTE